MAIRDKSERASSDDAENERSHRGEKEYLAEEGRHGAEYTKVVASLHMKAVLLHNIRSSHNVGSIFRTADAAGVSRVFLSGYTPAPVDRFKRPNKEIAKTALGAETFLPWEQYESPSPLLKRLRADGWYIVGIEQDARATDFRAFKSREKTLYVLGNEVRGLSKSLRDACDALIQIPMKGKKESLNVAVAAGIVLFVAN
jgi:23S rRNA (guanosine2251-2'-O)-methyltransferase